MSIKIVTTAIIKKPIEEVFEYVAPIDLAHIFRRHKYLPAVTHSNEKEKWVKSGLTRTVFFEDGNTAFEELLEVTSPTFFSYKISKFTSVLRLLVHQINGNWQFSTLENGETNVLWEYELIPRNRFTKRIIETFMYKDISTLCQNAINIIKTNLL